MKNLLAVLVCLFYGITAFAQAALPQTPPPQSKSAQPLQAKPDTGKALLNPNQSPSFKDTTTYKSYQPKSPGDSLYRHLPDAKEWQPSIIVNFKIIAGLGHINPNDVAWLTIFKEKDAPANLANLSRFGIITITLKKGVKIETNTCDDIKRRFGVSGKVRFAVDGYFVDDESMLISAQDINEINLTWKKNKDGSPDVTINIWMLVPEARKGPIAGRHSTDKPGEIYIRGSASK
ncbi:hypothetical protein ACRQ5D_07845 [Mucilaginibacter sp. P25]|uniref:Uncharacterized protein n=1 Tax=Mucilaginibacter gossypii TaxID=551996 RepID=A0A1G8AZJ4_9SPHI|nr:hypothetical protein [Mucilaginibacter gossypii]SDH26432.1 hypothetical protein SAMN05192573_10826 [Mucilaginibacter gossypii]